MKKLLLRIGFSGIIAMFCFQMTGQADYSCYFAYAKDTIQKSGFVTTKEKGYKFDTVLMITEALISAYPELDSTKIQIKSGKLKTLAAARPKADFIFKKKENRIYNIVISTKKKYYADSLYYYMDCHAFTGLLAHELAHIIQYNELSGAGLFFFSFKYLFNKRDVECATDELVIKRGYDKELLLLRDYIQHSPFTHPRYLKNKNANYLSAEEIKQKADVEYF